MSDMVRYSSPYKVMLYMGIPTSSGGVAQARDVEATFDPNDNVFYYKDGNRRMVVPVTSPLILEWEMVKQ